MYSYGKLNGKELNFFQRFMSTQGYDACRIESSYEQDRAFVDAIYLALIGITAGMLFVLITICLLV